MENKKAIWVKSSDFENLNFKKIKYNNIDTIFIHQQILNKYGKKYFNEWIKNAKKEEIEIHIWVQILYDGNWLNPIINGKKLNNNLLNTKIEEISEIANIPAISGIQLDYIRYPGNANYYENSTEAVTVFVKRLVNQIKKINKKLKVTGTLMPEPFTAVYGQNPRNLSKYLDAIVLMLYKGNYQKDDFWINNTTQWYVKNCRESEVWVGLQTYKSDQSPYPLSIDELNEDMKAAIDAKSDKIALFRYGLINLKNEVEMENKIDLTYSEKRLSKEEFKKINSKIDKYLNDGGIVKEDRFIYINYPRGNQYFLYWRYKEMLKRWNNFIKNNGHEPSYIYIKTPAVDISGDDKILPISTFLDMEERVNKYLKNGGLISDTRRIYLKMDEQLEYITYTKYKDLLERCDSWRMSKGTNPKFLYIITQSNSNNNRPEAVGNNILPNHNGWYLCQRYKSNSSAIKQENNHYCGPNAVQQLFYEISGKWYSEDKIAKIAGTGVNGTDHNGITKAIKSLALENNINLIVEWKYFSDMGYEELGRLIKDINIGTLTHLLYKSKYGHYEHVLGVNNVTGKILVANSLSGGWLEYRDQKTETKWLNLITQPSLCEVKIS